MATASKSKCNPLVEKKIIFSKISLKNLNVNESGRTFLPYFTSMKKKGFNLGVFKKERLEKVIKNTILSRNLQHLECTLLQRVFWRKLYRKKCYMT